MRPVAFVAVLAVAAALSMPAAVAGPGSPVTPPHSPSVLAAVHAPEAPAAGEDVPVRLQVTEALEVNTVALLYCRAERYVCAQPVLMERHGAPAATYEAKIPWRPSFFRDVENVGYAFIVRHANGTVERSPTADWPATPPSMPEREEGFYYFYRISPTVDAAEADAPAGATFTALVFGLAAVAARRIR